MTPTDHSALAHRVVELERLLNINDPTLKGVFKLSNSCSNLLGLLLNNEYVPARLAASVATHALDPHNPNTSLSALRMAVQRLRRQLAPFGIAVYVRHGVGYYLALADKEAIHARLRYAERQIPLPLPEPK